MKFEIDQKKIAETIKCAKNFECLNSNLQCCYKVEYRVYQEELLLKCLDNRNCSYKKPFGLSFMCNCPIRKEILNKYSI